MTKTGICYLAGAGPGDLGLVTLRAREVVGQADVIVYDYLCNPGILEWAPPAAEIIYAGKKAGAHTLTQEEITALLIDRTRAGKRVVRLKGGDPFVFGRGGEEAEALAREGLAFEVIPGVSSVFAGPAFAGIPVTHREHASQLTIFTGHEDPAKPGGGVDYAALARQPGTKVMLMGIERIGPVTEALLAHGADPALPVALIRWATTGRQQTLRARLDSIAARVAETGFSAPAIAVFGDVVNLRDSLNWFETRPLFGRRIIVTRTRQQAGALSSGLRALGADVWEIPTIRVVDPPGLMEFGQLVQDSHGYDWIIFTSPNGVDAFFKMFFKLYDDAREIGGVRIAVVGPATAARVREFHLKVDLQPAEYVAEAVVKELRSQGSIDNLRILIVRPEHARDVISKELTRLGAIVDEAIAYRNIPETADVTGGIERFRSEGADLITFTSSSTVENFLALKLPWPAGLATASIGPITSKTMRSLGLKVDIEARAHDVPGLIEAIRKHYVGK
jgi:uroporphyrinogen III methyltransferase/synthase